MLCFALFILVFIFFWRERERRYRIGWVRRQNRSKREWGGKTMVRMYYVNLP